MERRVSARDCSGPTMVMDRILPIATCDRRWLTEPAVRRFPFGLSMFTTDGLMPSIHFPRDNLPNNPLEPHNHLYVRSYPVTLTPSTSTSVRNGILADPL